MPTIRGALAGVNNTSSAERERTLARQIEKAYAAEPQRRTLRDRLNDAIQGADAGACRASKFKFGAWR